MLHKAKIKLNKDGSFAVIGIERYGYKRTVVVDKDNPLRYLELNNKGFRFQRKKSCEIYTVVFSDLLAEPAIPTNKLWENADRPALIYFIYDLIAMVSRAETDASDSSKGYPLEALCHKYQSCQAYWKGLDLKGICKAIRSNYKVSSGD